ncbi:MAG: class I SAM-dependent methyltransferase [Xanthobacteraceae bacterium]|jgi:SAM-dependent methyltransferase
MNSHSATLAFAAINDGKANFDDIYTSPDPRRYFSVLGQLDYIIPHLAQPVFDQLIQARAEQQDEPVTVLDLGCSYGVNGALAKYAVSFDAIRERYTSPHLQRLNREQLIEHDRAFYRAWPENPGVRVTGLDVSENAVAYAQESGAIDLGYALDLEKHDPSPEQAAELAKADIIVSTGCVGYVTSKTFERLAKIARKGRPAWVVSFVLRMFPYRAIAQTLEDQGLVTERFEAATFVQRRFATLDEMDSTVRAVESMGLDPYGREADGFFHADLFVSRPQAEIDRAPLRDMVSVVSGANKPWPIGANVLSGLSKPARRVVRARELRAASSN